MGHTQAPALPATWNVPHPRNLNFTGREALLEAQEATVASGAVAALTQTHALHGLGGVGKTQLAVEYAYRHASDYDVVWWVRAEEPTTLASDYAALAQKLDLPEQHAAEQALVVEAVRQWLEHHSGWLLIFDNATAPADLMPYLPHSHAGHVLITSRNPNWGEIAEPMRVPVLPPDDAVAFLLKRTHQSNHTAATQLAETLGRLPLALAQAGAYIEAKQLPLAAYLKLFINHRSKLLAQGKPLSYPDTVVTTWELSMRDIRQQSPAAVDLLSVCAFLGPDEIPTTMISEGAEHLPRTLGRVVVAPLEFEEALGALRRYSLIERSGDTLAVHRMVQAVVYDRLSDKNRQKWAAAAVRVVDKAFPFESNDVRTWRECAQLLPHALAASGYAEPLQAAPEATGRLLNQVGVYLAGRAEFAQAKAAHERALAIVEAALGPDHPDVATDLNNLGLVLRNLGDLEDAKAAHERALAINEAAYGPDHPTLGVRHGNLGNVLHDLGDLGGAKAHYERALAIHEATLSPDHPYIATGLNNLGGVLRTLGDLEGAKAAHERALAIGEAALGPDHPTVAACLNNLGLVLHNLGDNPGAKAHYERALAIDEAAYGPNHPDVARDLNNLGSVLQDLDDYSAAKAHYERALAIDQAAYGPNHPTVAIRLNNLGSVLRALGDYSAAKAHYERALTIDQAAYGPDHPNTKTVRNNLRIVEQQLGT